MNKFFTVLITLAALSIAIPASAQDCVPNLDRVAEIDTGAELYSATGGADCTEGAGATGCDVSAAAKEAAFGLPDPAFRQGFRVYFDNDLCQPGVGPGTCTFSLWGYFESNGIDGLQRDDGGFNDDGTEGADDTCGGVIAADFVFF